MPWSSLLKCSVNCPIKNWYLEWRTQLTSIKVHHSNKWQTFVTVVMNTDVPCLIDSIAQNLFWILHSCFGSQNIQCLLWTAQPTTVHHCTLPSARQYTIHQPISSRSILVSTQSTPHMLLYAFVTSHIACMPHALPTLSSICHHNEALWSTNCQPPCDVIFFSVLSRPVSWI